MEWKFLEGFDIQKVLCLHNTPTKGQLTWLLLFVLGESQLSIKQIPLARSRRFRGFAGGSGIHTLLLAWDSSCWNAWRGMCLVQWRWNLFLVSTVTSCDCRGNSCFQSWGWNQLFQTWLGHWSKGGDMGYIQPSVKWETLWNYSSWIYISIVSWNFVQRGC